MPQECLQTWIHKLEEIQNQEYPEEATNISKIRM